MRHAQFNGASFALAAGICVLAAVDGLNSSLSAAIRPYLLGSFASNADELSWAAIAYFTAKLGLLLLGSRLAEASSERAILLGGGALLVGATAAAGLTHSLYAFMICQALQGAGGGLVLAVGQGVLLRLYPSLRAPIAQAFFASAVLVCPVMVAPAMLGSVAYIGEWSYTMLLAAFSGACAWIAVYVTRDCLAGERRAARLPIPNIAALFSAIGCLVYALLEGARYAWHESTGIVGCLTAGVAALVCFALLERSSVTPLLEYGCFRLADFTFGICVSLLAGTALLGSSTAIGMLAAGSLGYTAMESGLVQLFAAPFALLALFTAAWLLRATRVPPPLLLLSGITLFGLGLWRLGFMHSNVAREHLLGPIALRGAGLGLLFLTLTMLTLRKLPSGYRIAGAGFFNFGRQFGGLIGLAWMLTLHERLMSRGHEALASSWVPSNAAFAEALAGARSLLMAQGTPAAEASSAAFALITAQFQQQTFALALNGCFQALAFLFVFALPLVALTRAITERALEHDVRRS